MTDNLAITPRDRLIWRAAMTLAHNALVQASDRIRADDGPQESLDLLSRQTARLRGFLEIDHDMAQELRQVLAEIGEANMTPGSTDV